MKYHNDISEIKKRIASFKLKDYKSKYPNWKAKLIKTNNFFCFLQNGKYRFSPVKYIMSVNEDGHEKTNSKEAREKAISLGFKYTEGHAKKEFEQWRKNNSLETKEDLRLLSYTDNSQALYEVKKYFSAENRLKELFIINGNKPLQGELGEWLFQMIFDATPMTVNSKGADFKIKNIRAEVKTKRPHKFNSGAIEITSTKIWGNDKTDYIAFFWLSESYLIKHLSLVKASDIMDKMGKKNSYEIKGHEHFKNDSISYLEELKNVWWDKLVKDKELLSQWMIDKDDKNSN